MVCNGMSVPMRAVHRLVQMECTPRRAACGRCGALRRMQATERLGDAMSVMPRGRGVLVAMLVPVLLPAQEGALRCRLVPSPGTGPMRDAAVASDGAVWTVDVNAGRLLRIDSLDAVRDVQAGAMRPQRVRGVARGPGDAIWYLVRDGVVGRLDPSGEGATETALEGRVGALDLLRRAPDGSLWFVDATRERLGHVALDGTVRLLEPPQSLTRRGPRTEGGGVQPLRQWPRGMDALAVAPDGALWIGSRLDNAVFRIVPGEELGTRRVEIPTPSAQVAAADVAGDGTVWFALAGARAVSRIAPGATTKTEHPVGGRVVEVLAARDGGAWFATASAVGHVARDGRVRSVDCGRQVGPLVEHPRSGVRSLGNQVIALVDTGSARAVTTTQRRLGTATGAARPVRATPAARAAGDAGLPMSEGIRPVAPAALDSALAEAKGSVVVYFTSDEGGCGYCVQMNDTINRLVAATPPGRATVLWVAWNPWRTVRDDPVARRWGLVGLPTLVHRQDGREMARVAGVRTLGALRELLGLPVP